MAATSSASAMSRPGRVAGLLDGDEDQVERVAVAGQARREAALVTEAGGQALALQHGLERVVDLGAPAQRLAERLGADRRDHELLDVHVGVGVRATVEDVQHRHRQHVRVRAADVAEQLQAAGRRGGLGDGERHAEDGVRAEPGLVRRAVQVDQLLVDDALLDRLDAGQLGADLVEHRGDRALDALAEVALRVAVAQLDGLVLTGRRAGRDRGALQRAVVQRDLDLDGGVASRVQDLAGADLLDDRHVRSLLAALKSR